MKTWITRSMPILGALLIASPLFGDSLLLGNGKILDGFVLLERENELIFQTEQTKLTISRDQIEEHVRETPAAYHLRLGEEALFNENFDEAEQHLTQALQIQSETERASIDVQEIRSVLEILRSGGEEAYHQYMQEQELAAQAEMLLDDGQEDEALDKYLTLIDMDSDDTEYLVQLANIYLEKAIEKLFLDPEEEQRLREMAAEPVENPNIEFTTSTSPDSLQIMDTGEEIITPFRAIEIAPLSIPAFREIHKDNSNLYNAIFYLEKLLKQSNAEPVLIHDPTCQQWFALLQLIQQEEKAYYNEVNQLSTQRAQRIMEDLVRQWTQNRQNEVQRLWNLVQAKARNGEWGYDLQDDIQTLRRLDPPAELRRQLGDIASQNSNVIEARRRVAQARQRTTPSRVRPGQVEVSRRLFSGRSSYRAERHAEVRKVDPLGY